MAGGLLNEALDILITQHDAHMKQAYERLSDGAEPDELSVLWAYSAGLQHAIRTFQDAMGR